jgi:hypothetical protein
VLLVVGVVTILLIAPPYAYHRETLGHPAPARDFARFLIRIPGSGLRSHRWRGWPEELARVALALPWPVAILGSLAASCLELLEVEWPTLLVSPRAAVHGTVGLLLGVAGLCFRRWYGRSEGGGPRVTAELRWQLATLALAAVCAATSWAVSNVEDSLAEVLWTVLMLSPVLGPFGLLLSALPRLYGRSWAPGLGRAPALLLGLAFVALCAWVAQGFTVEGGHRRTYCKCSSGPILTRIETRTP